LVFVKDGYLTSLGVYVLQHTLHLSPKLVQRCNLSNQDVASSTERGLKSTSAAHRPGRLIAG
jgi:hypothetical protein